MCDLIAGGLPPIRPLGPQGGFSWRSPRPPPPLEFVRRAPRIRAEVPYVLSYVLLLVQMVGGGPLMRLLFYFGVLFIAREGKCGAKRREKFDCWACQHQFLVNNSHSNARCMQELLLLRLKSLLLCVLAGWFLQERGKRGKQASK